jgi:hypothetical protein
MTSTLDCLSKSVPPASVVDKVLDHVLSETKKLQVSALVFVGDAMEENSDVLAGVSSGLILQ